MSTLTYNFKKAQLFTDPFSFHDHNFEIQHPMSPFVTLKVEGDKLFARYVVFTESPCIEEPYIEYCNINQLSSAEVQGEVRVQIDYLSHYDPESTLPINYIAWFIDLDISLQGLDVEAKTVLTTLRNKDPKTSRGTVTSVPKPTNDLLAD